MSRSDYEEADDYQLSMEDLLWTTDYALTNSDLEPFDHRLQFVKSLQAMREGNGRLHSAVTPILAEG